METIRKDPRKLGPEHPVSCYGSVLIYDAVKVNRIDYDATEALQERMRHVLETAYAAGIEDALSDFQSAAIMYPTSGWPNMLLYGPEKEEE